MIGSLWLSQNISKMGKFFVMALNLLLQSVKYIKDKLLFTITKLNI
jgi:hypothetical protein